MKTSELTGTALDWAVGVAEGMQWQDDDPEVGLYHRRDYQYRNDRLVLNALDDDLMDDWSLTLYSPSTDWAQGGPIIEREGISVLYRTGVRMIANINGQYEQTIGHRHKGNIGLLVAMRCYVASKMGDEITLPKEMDE